MALEIRNQTRQQHTYNLLSGKSITLMPITSVDITGKTDRVMIGESDGESVDIVNGRTLGHITVTQIHIDKD